MVASLLILFFKNKNKLPMYFFTLVASLLVALILPASKASFEVAAGLLNTGEDASFTKQSKLLYKSADILRYFYTANNKSH